jgi:hypothetical protein
MSNDSERSTDSSSRQAEGGNNAAPISQSMPLLALVATSTVPANKVSLRSLSFLQPFLTCKRSLSRGLHE